MSSSTARGHFVWHDLMTTDTKSAAEFYTKIVGWKTKPWNESITMFMCGKQPMAGLMVLPDDAKKMGAPPTWLSYIGTPDVDETVRQATSRGATMLKAPTDIPVGRFAVLQDPQGAAFAVFKGAEEMPSNPKPGIGDFSWHELATTDWRAALEFYTNLFGWEATDSMDMGSGMGTYQMFGWKGRTIGGMYTKPAQQPGPPAWLPYIRVADTKKAVSAIKNLGGQVLNGPMEVPGGDLIAQGLDRQGGAFAVHSVKPAAKAAPEPAAKAAPVRTRPRKAARKPAKKVAKGRPAARKAPAKAKRAARSGRKKGGRKRR